MVFLKLLVVFALSTICQAQRPFFAGLSPVGIAEPTESLLENRFGEEESLPLEVKGQNNLGTVKKIERMPESNQPFWYLNADKYEDLRQNPKTWPQKENPFKPIRPGKL